MRFKVIDKRTGKEPIFDGNHIFKEKWFKESNLIYCDIDGWYISEDGVLVLVDDCGRVGYPPQDRFKVVLEERPHGKWIDKVEYAECSICGGCSGTQFDGVEPIPLKTNFCPNCGSDNRKRE